MVINHEESPGGARPSQPPVIFNPDFFVEKLRHENPDIFLELVLSNITRLIDLPGTEFAQLLGEEGPKIPTGGNGGFLSLFQLPQTQRSTSSSSTSAKICTWRVCFGCRGNSVRQQTLKELLNSGVDVDLESGDFHPNDVATLLKTFLGELPEPLLTQRHFHAHLKIADLTLFDELGNKTALPNKERQIEALQLLFLLLPQANRSLLKLLLDLLYHTARQQDKNKMSAFNLALMFAPHVVWPRNMTACDLKDNLKKLNSSMAFLIKHSQKLFRAPVYLLCRPRMIWSCLQPADLLLSGPRWPLKRSAPPQEQCQSPAQQYTEEALKDLFRHVNHSMPDSAKKKKLVRQLVKQTASGTPTNDRLQVPTHCQQRNTHVPRSFGGLIKRKARGEQPTAERRLRQISPDVDSKSGRKAGKENVILQGVNSPLNGPHVGEGRADSQEPGLCFQGQSSEGFQGDLAVKTNTSSSLSQTGLEQKLRGQAVKCPGCCSRALPVANLFSITCVERPVKLPRHCESAGRRQRVRREETRRVRREETASPQGGDTASPQGGDTASPQEETASRQGGDRVAASNNHSCEEGGERMWAREIDRNKEKGEEREKRAAVTGGGCSHRIDPLWHQVAAELDLTCSQLFKPFPHRTLSPLCPLLEVCVLQLLVLTPWREAEYSRGFCRQVSDLQCAAGLPGSRDAAGSGGCGAMMVWASWCWWQDGGPWRPARPLQLPGEHGGLPRPGDPLHTQKHPQRHREAGVPAETHYPSSSLGYCSVEDVFPSEADSFMIREEGSGSLVKEKWPGENSEPANPPARLSFCISLRWYQFLR
ncbi:hypothetical protein KUCAC02_019274 [Chaenocephalus aceratus]|nr:hypothetical protein KUCAC02_019274 [Chaenocephalus aceratus]